MTTPAVTAKGAPANARGRFPVAFRVWVVGALASQLGDAVMYFALGWAATAHGGAAAGLVLSAVALPRTVLLLFGGAAGDRLGARRVMITGDGVMLVVAGSVGVIAWWIGTPLPVLLTAAVVIGVVDAFYLPSAGSMPRRLVSDAQLSRAVAVRQSGSQLVSMIGGPIGGLVVAVAGFAAAAWGDAVTFAVVLVVLIGIRSRVALPAPERRGGVMCDIGDGLRVVLATPGLRATLVVVGGAAGFIIPVSSLLVPLLARAHGWGAGAAGLIIGAQAVGVIGVTLLVARRGSGSRPGLIALAGLVVAAGGQLVLALAPGPAWAGSGALLIGIGSGVFVSHWSPVLLGAAPRSHLARVQAMLSLVQSVALLVSNNILGNVARAFSAADAVGLCVLGVLVCACVGFASPGVRRIATQTPSAP